MATWKMLQRGRDRTRGLRGNTDIILYGAKDIATVAQVDANNRAYTITKNDIESIELDPSFPVREGDAHPDPAMAGAICVRTRLVEGPRMGRAIVAVYYDSNITFGSAPSRTALNYAYDDVQYAVPQAMIDASIGGKTGVNLPRGKNLVGAFHQPRGVFIDTATLASLPMRQRAAGLAERVVGKAQVAKVGTLAAICSGELPLEDCCAEAMDDTDADDVPVPLPGDSAAHHTTPSGVSRMTQTPRNSTMPKDLIAILAALGATDAAQGLQIATDRAAFRTKVLSATKAESDDAALGTLHAWQRDASAAADLRVQLDADRKARAAEERKGLLAAAVRIFQQRGVSPAHIHFEHFDFR